MGAVVAMIWFTPQLGRGVVSSGLSPLCFSASLLWGFLGRGMVSLTTKHILDPRPSQTDQPAQPRAPRAIRCPATPTQPVLFFCYGWPAGRTMSFLPVRYDYLLSPSEFGSSSSRESVNGLLVSLTTCSSHPDLLIWRLIKRGQVFPPENPDT